MKNHLKKVSSQACLATIGIAIAASFSGCEQKSEEKAPLQNVQKNGATVYVQETAPNQYKIIDEHPSENTRVILKDINGTERILSQSEIDALVKAEAKKIDNNTSSLTNPSLSSGGMSLGETILASAAGAIIGSWIGSKLFNNQNYDQQRRTTYQNPSTYSKSKDNFKSTGTNTPNTSAKSGYFGNNKAISSTPSTASSNANSFGG